MPDGSGTLPGPESEEIAPATCSVHDKDDETQQPAKGEHLMGAKPAPAITLAGDSYTEVEFTVKVSAAIELGQRYDFRLVAGPVIVGAAVAQVHRRGPARAHGSRPASARASRWVRRSTPRRRRSAGWMPRW